MLGRTLRNSRVLPRSIGEVLTDYSEMWQFIAKKRLTSPALLKILPGLVDTGLWILGAIVLLGIFLLLTRNTLIGLTSLIFIAGVCASPWPQQYLRYLLPISAVVILAAAEIVIRICASIRAVRVRHFLIATMVATGAIVLGERLLALYLSDTSLLQPAWVLRPA